MRTLHIHSLTLGLLGLLVTGCQGAGEGPAVPHTRLPATPAAMSLPLGADPNAVGVAVADLLIDLSTGSATLEPVRGATAIGDAFSELGLRPAFSDLFGPHFEVVGLRSTGATTVEIDFRIDHPFSAATRPDLAIFNLKLWMVTDQPGVSLGAVNAAAGLVMNADGYGRMWTDTASSQPGFTSAAVQPYVVMNEDPTSAAFDWQNPAGFNVFFPGMESTDTVALDLEGQTQISVRVYLTADYGQSAVRATRQSPQYSLPEFAGNAAWKISVTELSNTLEGGNPSSTAEYQVDIWDWKHGTGLGSDVASATLEIPGVTSAASTLSLSGAGQDPDPLTATTLITNSASAPDGDYWGIVEVTDSATNGVGLEENLVTPITIPSYVTWQLFPVQIEFVPMGDPPTAVLERDCPGQPVTPGAIVSLDGMNSIPGFAPIVDYEWDFDYDGLTFNIDATGAQTTTSYASLGAYTVALRVRAQDSQVDLATTLVTVLPTAMWGTPQRLTTTPERELFDTAQNSSNALCVSADGRVHLAWFTQGPYQVWYQSFMPSPTPLTWDPAETIVAPSGSVVGHISCQADGSNNPVVMYARSTAGQPRECVTRMGGVWGTPAVVPASADPGSWERTIMVSDAAGTLGFLGQWTRGDQPPVGSGDPSLPNDMYFTTRTVGSWAPLELIGAADTRTSENGGGRVASHALVATDSGEWLTVWESLYTPHMGGPTGVSSQCKLIWNTTTGGTWGTQSDLYADGTDYDLPILARSPNGRIWLGARTVTDAWGLVTYDGTTWDPTFTQVFDPTGVTFSRLPLTQFAFDALGRGCLLVSYREPEAPIQAKFLLETDSPATVAACTALSLEPQVAGVGRPMCQIAQHGDGRFTGIWLTTAYNPGNPYFAETELQYSTFE